MPHVGWVCCWTSLLCSARFLSGYSSICLSSKTKGEFDWTYCYKSLVPWFLDCLNTTYVGIFYFEKIYRHWNALNAKTNDFWSLFHSFLFWNIVNRTLPNIPKSKFNPKWKTKNHHVDALPFKLFVYLFIFYYALLDECLTQKNQLTKETIPRNIFSLWTVLLTITESEKSGLSFEGWEKF